MKMREEEEWPLASKFTHCFFTVHIPADKSQHRRNPLFPIPLSGTWARFSLEEVENRLGAPDWNRPSSLLNFAERSFPAILQQRCFCVLALIERERIMDARLSGHGHKTRVGEKGEGKIRWELGFNHQNYPPKSTSIVEVHHHHREQSFFKGKRKCETWNNF